MGESDWRPAPREFPELFGHAVSNEVRAEAERLIVGRDPDVLLHTRKKLEEVLRAEHRRRTIRKLKDKRGAFARNVAAADVALSAMARVLRPNVAPGLHAARAEIHEWAAWVETSADGRARRDHYHQVVGDLFSIGWANDDAKTLLRAVGFKLPGRVPD